MQCVVKVPFCFSRSLSCAHCMSGRRPRGTFCAHARTADHARIAILCLILLLFFFVQLACVEIFWHSLALLHCGKWFVSSTASRTTVVILTMSVYCRQLRKVFIMMNGGPAIYGTKKYNREITKSQTTIRSSKPVICKKMCLIVLLAKQRHHRKNNHWLACLLNNTRFGPTHAPDANRVFCVLQ